MFKRKKTLFFLRADRMSCFGIFQAPGRRTDITSHPDPPILRLLHSPAMADKVKEVAVGEADRIKSLTVEAARSAAYLYPIKASC